MVIKKDRRINYENKSDYDLIKEDDVIDVIGLTEFAPGKLLKVVLHHVDGSRDEFSVTHTYNQSQIEWFKSGSALNMIRKQSN